MATLGVDEHVWHHTPAKAATKGPTMLTGMVDLTRDARGQVRARLLDLVPGRTGKAYADWLTERTEQFRDGVQVATLDPFRGYANAIADELDDAVPVLDAFHVVKLAIQVTDEVRRRVQQDTLGHRGMINPPELSGKPGQAPPATRPDAGHGYLKQAPWVSLCQLVGWL